MQRTLLSIGALFALVVVFLLVARRDDPARLGGALTADEATSAAAPTPAELAGTPSVGEAARTLVSVAEAAPAPADVSALEGACVVFGRVVDVDRRPVADASVQISAYNEWAEGHDIPRIDEYVDYRGFVTRTDATGTFRFAVPPPTNVRQRLTVAATPFLDSFSTTFGEGTRERRPGLAAGETDLGELVLGVTGAVSGRVVDERGAPIAGAVINLGPTQSSTYSRDTRTRADGTFQVAHAPIGTYGVKAEAIGFVNAFVSPVTIEARRETAGVEFKLAIAESIQGTVRDEQGAPLAGARLRGWPKSSGRGAGAKSGDDGYFTIFLPQSEPYTLAVTLDGYEPWGDENDKHLERAVGARDIEVVLKVMERLQVTVVDDVTGERLERFGVAVLAVNGSRSPRHISTERRRPPDKDHADGVALVTARSGVDLLIAAADGYLFTWVDANGGEASPPTQTIRLRRAPVVRGRAWRDGAPLANAAVELVGGQMDTPRERLSSTDPASVEAHLAAQRTKLRWFRPEQNGARTTRTDDAGRFALAPERPGELRLTIDAGAGHSLVRAPLRTSGDDDLDLGDLYADASGRIEGTVVVPEGALPAGLKVFIGDWVEDAHALVDAAGRFNFDDLAPGNHLLMLDDRPGVLAGSKGVMLEVRAGETTPITLDASDKGMCELVLRFEAPGIDLVGQQVSLPDLNETFGNMQLGLVGDDGIARGSVRAFDAAIVHLFGLGISFTDQPLELVAFERIERTLRLAVGSLELLWPPGLTLPEGAEVRLSLEPITEGTPTQSLNTRVSSEATAPGPTRANLAGATFEQVVAGRSRLNVMVTDQKQRQETKLPNGGTRYSALVLFETTAEVVIAPSERTRLQL